MGLRQLHARRARERLQREGSSVFGSALAALVAAQGAASHPSEGVRWVPLDQSGNQGPKKQIIPASSSPASQTVAVAEQTSPNATPNPAPPTVTRLAPISALSAPSTANGPLQITCFGGGTANKVASATAWSNSQVSGTAFGSRGGMATWSGSGSGTTTVYGTRQQGFGDQVDVRLFNGVMIASGCHGRCFRHSTAATPAGSAQERGRGCTFDSRAKAAVNFMNNPNVFIDRVTGTISISGRAGDYSGQCQAIEASSPTKF